MAGVVPWAVQPVCAMRATCGMETLAHQAAIVAVALPLTALAAIHARARHHAMLGHVKMGSADALPDSLVRHARRFRVLLTATAVWG